MIPSTMSVLHARCSATWAGVNKAAATGLAVAAVFAADDTPIRVRLSTGSSRVAFAALIGVFIFMKGILREFSV